MREHRLISSLAGVCVVTAVVLSGHFAAAALPGKATLISPSGTDETETPTYSWNADANSSWYYLWVNDSTGTRIQKWYTADQVGCPGAGICYAIPDVALVPGSAKWWIQTWSLTGNGPWSDGMAFTVKSPEPPGKVTLISPLGIVGNNTPTYIWNADPNSTWYYLWVNDSTGTRIQKWYTIAQAACHGGEICSATPDIALASGSAKWWIRTWNESGDGPWSDGRELTVPAPVPPGKANLVSPSGSITSKTPNYTWAADAYSTWYYLWVNDSTGTRIQKWYTAAQAGCPLGVGTCVAWPGSYLEQGPAKWWIQTWSPNGRGPWSDSMAFTVPAPVPGSMVDLGAFDNSWSSATGLSTHGSVVVGRSLTNSGDWHAFRWTQATGMVDLGTLGGSYSVAQGVSADGSVVVGSSTNNAGFYHAFRWTQAGGMVDLGTLGGLRSRASAVSMDGSVVVGTSADNAERDRAFRWTQAGGMVDLGTLGGLHSYTNGLSADGTTVVGTSKNNAGVDRAFRWTQAGGMVDLGTLGASFSSAAGVSAGGSVVVGLSANNFGEHRAFRWTQAGGMVDLGTLGGSYSKAVGLSTNGSVVIGDSTNSSVETHAFRWTQAGGMVDLGTLGGSYSEAEGVSIDGSTVVGHSSNGVGEKRAFRWTQAGGMLDLGTLGGSYSEAVGVSADGSAVAGFSANNAGKTHAFRWK